MNGWLGGCLYFNCDYFEIEMYITSELKNVSLYLCRVDSHSLLYHSPSPMLYHTLYLTYTLPISSLQDSITLYFSVSLSHSISHSLFQNLPTTLHYAHSQMIDHSINYISLSISLSLSLHALSDSFSRNISHILSSSLQ